MASCTDALDGEAPVWTTQIPSPVVAQPVAAYLSTPLSNFFHYSTSRDLMSAIQISNNKSWYQWDRQRTNGSLDIQSARQSIDIDRFRKMGEGGDKIKTYKNS